MKSDLMKKIAALALSAFMLFPEIMPSLNGVVAVYADAASDKAALDMAIADVNNNIVTDSGILSAPLVESDGELYLVDSIHLPTLGASGNAIEWSSDNPSVISTDGVVTRPKEENAKVTLTASISGGETAQLELNVASLISGVGGAPALESVKKSYDFVTDGTRDEYVIRRSTGDTICDITGGYLMLSKRAADQIIGIHTYGSGETLSEGETRLYTEFVLKRAGEAGDIKFEIGEAWYDGARNSNLVTWSDGKMTFFSDEYPDGFDYAIADTSCRLAFLLDPIKDSYRAYVNGVEVATEPFSVKSKTEKLSMFRVTVPAGSEEDLASGLKIDSYRFYNPVLTDIDMCEADLRAITVESILTAPLLSDGRLHADLILPTVGINGCAITWSEPQGIVDTATGVVTRPTEDTAITLTVTAEINGVTSTKEFNFIVAAAQSADQQVSMDIADITLDSILSAPLTTWEGVEYLTNSLHLPTMGVSGSVIKWSSTNSAVISETTGVVTRPASGNAKVTLTATVSDYAETVVQTKEFIFNVAALDSGVGGVPALMDIIDGTDFLDDYNSADHNLELRSDETSYSIKDGYLVIGGHANFVTQIGRLHPQPDWSSEGTEPYYAEFVLKSFGEAETISILLCEAWNAQSIGVELNWRPTRGTLEIIGSETYSTTYEQKKMRVGFMIDPLRNTYRAYVNGIEVTNGKTPMNNPAAVLDMFLIAIKQSTGEVLSDHGLMVDSYHIYRKLPADDDLVAADLDAITENDLLTEPLLNGMLIADLDLPTFGDNGTTVTWSAEPQGIIDTTTGAVTRPAVDTEVTLTATVTLNNDSDSKDFTFMVRRAESIEDMIRQDFDAITKESLLMAPLVTCDTTGTEYLMNSLNLPSEGINGTSFSWDISRPDVITEDSDVLRPSGEDVEVTLTPVGTLGGVTLRSNTSFTFTVPALSTQVNGMPAMTYMTAYNSFDSSEQTDPRIELYQDTKDNVSFVDGVARLGSIVGTSDTRMSIYTEKDKIPSTKPFFVEYVMKKSATNIRLRADMGAEYGTYGIRMDWKSSSITLNGSATDGNKKVEYKFTNYPEFKETISYGLLIDPVEKTYKVWINGKKMLEGVFATDCETLLMELGAEKGRKNQYVDICEYRMYSLADDGADLSDDEKVAADYDYLTIDSEAGGSWIQLPKLGRYGSEITWTSSDTSIIDIDGTITRPVGEGNTPVTLTATIISGDSSETKEFKINVAWAMVGTVIAQRDAELITFESLLTDVDIGNGFLRSDLKMPSTGANGSTIIWTSSHPNVLTKKGKVYRPSGKGYTEVTLTASISYGNTGSAKKDIVFKVLHTGSNVPSAITVKNSLWSNDFDSDADLTKGISFIPDAEVSREIVDGKLVVKTDGNGALTSTSIYPVDNPADATVQKGLLGMEFTLGRENGKNGNPVNFDLMASEALRCFTASWNSDGTVSATYRPNSDSNETKTVKASLGDELKVQIYFDTDNGMFDLWINGELLVLDGYTLDAGDDAKGILKLLLYGTNAAGNDFYVDGIKFFEPVANEEARKQHEANSLEQGILGTNESLDEVKEALNLVSKGFVYGYDVEWESSNPEIVAPSGGVNNPKWDEEAAQVILTATVGGTAKVEIPVTVIPHRYIGDPENERVSDEDFFGVWNGSEWTDIPELDYDRVEELSKIEEAAKAGNYDLAKEELLEYMRYVVENDSSGMPGGNSRYAPFLLDGGMDNQNNTYYLNYGSVDSDEYEEVIVDLSTRHKAAPNTAITYHIMSKKNDSVSITIAGSTYPVEEMRPKLRLYVNGMPREYDISDSATLRTGNYLSTALNQTDELTVKIFGEFMGDETYSSVMKFGPFTDITSSDKLGRAELVFYAKKSNGYSEPKLFNVMMEPDTSWKGKDAFWKYFGWQYYSYPGLYEGKEWDIEKHPSYENNYNGMSKRFQRQHYLGGEFKRTGNEEYAYVAIRDMMTFMEYFADPTIPRTASGGKVTSEIRMDYWMGLFKQVIDSKYMTPDVCTAFVKRYTRSIPEHLSAPGETVANGTITTYTILLRVFTFFDCLRTTPKNQEDLVSYITGLMPKTFWVDGAYTEDTSGYASGVLSDILSMRKYLEEHGIAVPAEFDEYLRIAAIYDLMMFGPNRELLGYGDGSLTADASSPNYTYLCDLLGDEELRFLNSKGRQGTEPEWTSLVLPVSTYSFLQDSWKTDATKALFNVRRGGMHGNRDDNHLNLFAFGKRLLTDAGKVTYTMGDTYDRVDSTIMHNTVEVDGTNQDKQDPFSAARVGQGSVEASALNDNFDLVSLRSLAYEHIGNYHTRSLTFVKPDFFIVSDLMTPEDSRQHEYKQAWHMTPEADLSTTEDGIIRSNFKTAGNLLIKNADNYEVKEAVGIHETGMGGYAEPIYGYYHVKASGDVSIDTVLLPYNSTTAELDVERIDMQASTGEVTALKIMTEKNDIKTTTYYMLDYNKMHGIDKNHGVRTFGKYETDAMLAVVVEDENGNPIDFNIADGSYIKSIDGTVYADFGSIVPDGSFAIDALTLDVAVSDTEYDISEAKLKVNNQFNTVRVNEQSKVFNTANGVVNITNTDKYEAAKKDDNNAVGIVDRIPQGGNEGPGGNPGGNTPGGNPGVVIPGGTDTPAFTDIDNHWAEDNIETAAEKGLVTGYPDGTFGPDNDITRAEFLALTCRAIELDGVDYNGEFADVPMDAWYADILAAALEAGIISEAENFRPDDNITREEMCKILTIALKLFMDMSEVPGDYAIDYADNANISDWATEYVTFVSYYKIMNGMENGDFAPLNNATRGEAATVLVRSLNK